MTHPKTLAKFVQLQDSKNGFWYLQRLGASKRDVDHNHNKHQLYNTLCTIMISPWQANKLAQPLFHTISPMATKEGYLMQYLPQYHIKAKAAIAPFVNCHPAGLAPSIATTPSMARQIILATQLASMAPHPQDKFNKLFRLQFTGP